MNLENLKRVTLKLQIVSREIMLYPAAVIYFPWFTIRILCWKWYFWILSNNATIKAYLQTHNEL